MGRCRIVFKAFLYKLKIYYCKTKSTTIYKTFNDSNEFNKKLQK